MTAIGLDSELPLTYFMARLMHTHLVGISYELHRKSILSAARKMYLYFQTEQL